MQLRGGIRDVCAIEEREREIYSVVESLQIFKYISLRDLHESMHDSVFQSTNFCVKDKTTSRQQSQ